MINRHKVRNTVMAAAFGVALATLSAPAMAVTWDGIMTSLGEYSESFTASWINGHEKESIYSDGTDTTTVSWATDASNFFLFIPVPIYAKNMIWGSGVTAAEVALYQGHWSTHHSGTVSMDYNRAVGSEKLILGLGTFKLKDDAQDGMKNSREWLIANTSCTVTDCDAATMAMSFEFKLALGLKDSVLADIVANGLNFHLSPERRGPLSVIPLPAALPLYGAGLALMGFFGWRKKQLNQSA